jgi:hypothetical protein
VEELGETKKIQVGSSENIQHSDYYLELHVFYPEAVMEKIVRQY